MHAADGFDGACQEDYAVLAVAGCHAVGDRDVERSAYRHRSAVHVNPILVVDGADLFYGPAGILIIEWMDKNAVCIFRCQGVGNDEIEARSRAGPNRDAV